jgi:hypothetical protein
MTAISLRLEDADDILIKEYASMYHMTVIPTRKRV